MSTGDTPHAPPAWLARPSARLMVWAVQSPINVGMIVRAAEGFQLAVTIYDPSGLFDRTAERATISDFACGALERIKPTVISDEAAALTALSGGRVLATAITPDATDLAAFRFRRTDQIVLGNEYDGLPDHLMARADVRLTIPMPAGCNPKSASHSPIDPDRTRPVARDGTPNLNVATSAGILAYKAYLDARRAVAKRA